MGVELRLTDRQLPASPVFVDFLAHLVDGRPFEDHGWHDQRAETLNTAGEAVVRRAPQEAARVMADPRGRSAVARAYRLLMALLIGDLNTLQRFTGRYRFLCVVGIPRTGGSYLTKECFRALGHEPGRVPNALAHDGFPEAAPFQLRAGVNAWTVSLQTMAEYLVMVEEYFGSAAPEGDRITVPKKLTKGCYAGGLFRQVFGDEAEYVVTLRHPVTACISTYEKSGGLPESGRFAVRSNIEQWCQRDLATIGIDTAALATMDYFEAYLRYWELYHLQLALSGLLPRRRVRVLAYGRERMETQAAALHRAHGSRSTPEAFHVDSSLRHRHPEWIARARPAITRVAQTWESCGLPFPVDQLEALW